MIEAGVPADEARALTRLVGLTKDKPPETDSEWEEVISASEDVGGLKADSTDQ